MNAASHKTIPYTCDYISYVDSKTTTNPGVPEQLGLPEQDDSSPVHGKISVPTVDMCLDGGTVDHVLVLGSRSTSMDYYPGKRFGLDRYGKIRKLETGKILNWSARLFTVDGIQSLHNAISRVSSGEEGFAVVLRSDVHPHANPRWMRRTLRSRPAMGGKPAVQAGLIDCARLWFTLDFDHVPNLHGLDPRRDSEAAVQFLLSLLPAAFHGLSVSWQWSSSCCAGLAAGDAPAELSAHIRVYTDTPLASTELRPLLNRLRAFTTRSYMKLTGEYPALMTAPDPAMANANQAAYTLKPIFMSGAVDPFLDAPRYGLFRGERDVLCLGELVTELDAEMAQVAPVTASAGSPAPSLTLNVEKAPKAVPQVRTEDMADIRKTLAAEMDERAHQAQRDAAMLAAARKTNKSQGQDQPLRTRGAGRIRGDVERWAKLALQQLGALIDARKATMAGWEAGVPEGMRSRIMYTAIALISENVRFTMKLLPEARAWAAGRFSEDWLATDWREGETSMVQVARFAMSKAGVPMITEVRKLDGAVESVERSARMRVSRDYICTTMDLSPAEQQAYPALASTRVTKRHQAQRRQAKLNPYGLDVPVFKKSPAPDVYEWEGKKVSKATYFRKMKAVQAAAGVSAAKEKKVFQWNGKVVPESTYYRLRKQEALRQAVAHHLATQLPPECHQTISEHLLERRDVRDVLNILRAALRSQNLICMLRVAARPFCDFQPQDVYDAAERVYDGCSILDVLCRFGCEDSYVMATTLKNVADGMFSGASPAEVLEYIIDEAGYRRWSLSPKGGQMAPEDSALDRLVTFARHYDGKMMDFIEIAAPYFEDDNFQSIVHEDFEFTPEQLTEIEWLSVNEPAPKPVVTSEPKRRIKRQSIW